MAKYIDIHNRITKTTCLPTYTRNKSKNDIQKEKEKANSEQGFHKKKLFVWLK